MIMFQVGQVDLVVVAVVEVVASKRLVVQEQQGKEIMEVDLRPLKMVVAVVVEQVVQVQQEQHRVVLEV
jgi:hypothetical protein